MPTAASIMTDLKSKGSEKTRKTYARHGNPKKIKGQQTLACELYKTGKLEAMYLAGLVADGSQLTRKQLQEWAEDAAKLDLQMVAECTIPWVTVESPHARDLAMEWMKSRKENLAPIGWSTYAGLIATRADESLDLDEIAGLLNTVVKGIDPAKNRVRHKMNSFVIAVGTYVKPLFKHAKETARKIGVVSVDMGDTACKVPVATAYIEKIEAAGRVGQKRKTLRC
jgi:hypothetical protein